MSKEAPTVKTIAADVASAFSSPVTGESVLNLRLSQDFAAIAFGKQVLVDVSVGKPPKGFFWRIRPGETYSAILYTLDATKQGSEGTYVVGPDIVGLVQDQVRLVTVRLAITSLGVPYLVPVPLPGPDGRTNAWHLSLARAVEMAEQQWIRISANMARGGYDVFTAIGQLPEPNWPTESFETLLELGFRGRLITSEEHPLVQQLLGA